jgi:membrane protease YdiL (CAAX protease family)
MRLYEERLQLRWAAVRANSAVGLATFHGQTARTTDMRCSGVSVADPPVPSRLMFSAFVASTVGTFTGTALILRTFGIPLEHAFSTPGQLKVVGVELVLGVLWALLLRRRGWSLACITMPPNPPDVGRGVGLVALLLFANRLTTALWGLAFPGAMHAVDVDLPSPIAWWAIAAVSIVNPMAEELVYLGFIANVLRPRGELFAIVAAVLARMAVHLYREPRGVVGIAVLGVLLSVYYYRTRRLWPVVVAHSLLDVLALIRMNMAAG